MHCAPSTGLAATLSVGRSFEHEPFISHGVSPYLRSGSIHRRSDGIKATRLGATQDDALESFYAKIASGTGLNVTACLQ